MFYQFVIMYLDFFLVLPAYSWFVPLILAANKVLGEWNTSKFGICVMNITIGLQYWR